MLIFLSDLHFVDGTAGEHNVKADAFTIFFQDLAALVDWHKNKGRKVREIKLVFLGDIFDLLRTEKWFGFPADDRPWGDNEPRIQANADTIFDGILNNEENRKTFALLGSPLQERFGLPFEPERIYIPGNHDRLCNKYPKLREKVRRALNIKASAEPFHHFYLNEEYAVFARHGHEFDKFNYEGSIGYEPADYMRVPIGDPITTELVAKLPWKLMNHKAIAGRDDRDQLERNFQELENVRPLAATLEWLLYQVKKKHDLKMVIEDVVDEVVQEFNELAFVKRWYSHHDKWTDWHDEADKIQAALFLLEKFKVFPSERIFPLIVKLKDMLADDKHRKAAAGEFTHLNGNIRYVVYGHTHEPRQTALRTLELPEGREQIYLNTGTWRSRHHKNSEDMGFNSWKNLTYLIFYLPEEKNAAYPTFETWTGTLKEAKNGGGLASRRERVRRQGREWLYGGERMDAAIIKQGVP